MNIISRILIIKYIENIPFSTRSIFVCLTLGKFYLETIPLRDILPGIKIL